MKDGRLKFGGRKYAAYNLMMARWLANAPTIEKSYYYVTLGGTELYDVVNICWVRKALIEKVIAFELGDDRYKLAKATGQMFASRGINIDIIHDDIFQYERNCDLPHIYFIDLEGVLSLIQHGPYLTDWFIYNQIRPNDVIFITSYLGRNPGWSVTLKPFSMEFKLLRSQTANQQKELYQAMHPGFILYRSLLDSGTDKELDVKCMGYIRYHDTSPMGIYGFTCCDGKTDLNSLTTNVPILNTVSKEWQLAYTSEQI